MKKLMNLFAAVAMMALSSCGTQFGLGTQGTTTSTTANTDANTAVGNILQSVLGLNKMTQSNLIGTWTYNQPGCAFSSQQLLAQAGGEVVATQIKSQLKPTFQKAGINSGNTQVTFKQDGTFSAKIAGKAWSGNYTFDEATSKIQMTGLLLNINCYAKKNADGIGILFEASKLLSLLQTMSTLSGHSSTQGIGDLSKIYDGLRMVFDMN